MIFLPISSIIAMIHFTDEGPETQQANDPTGGGHGCGFSCPFPCMVVICPSDMLYLLSACS